MKRAAILLVFLMLSCNQKKSREVESLLLRSENHSLSSEEKIESLKKSQILVENIEDDSLKVNYYFKIANRYWNNNELAAYLSTSKLALKYATKQKNPTLMSKGYQYIGDYYSSPKINKDDSAFYYYSKSEQNNTFNDKSIAMELYISKARLLFKNGDYSGAEINFLKPARFFKNIDPQRQYLFLVNLGLVSREFKDYDRAIAYMEQALHLVRADDRFTEIDIALVLNNIGRTLLDIEQYSKAENCFEEALRFKNVHKDHPILYAVLLENLGVAKYCLDIRDKQSESLLLTASKIKDSAKYDQASSRVNYSKYLLLKKDSIAALKVAKEGYSIARLSRNPQEVLLSLKNILELSKYPQTSEVLEYIQIRDSLQTAERKASTIFARIQYETDKIKYEKDKILKQQYIILLIFGSSILIAIILLIIKHYKDKQKQLYLVKEQQETNEKIYDLILGQNDKFEKIRLAEQRRIARELHDGIINRLVSTRFNLFALVKHEDEKVSMQSAKYMDEIQRIEEDIKNISYNLEYNNSNFQRKFEMTLLDLIDELSFDNVYIDHKIDKEINWDNVDIKTRVHIYRILQEGLLNMAKHSHAERIIVRVEKRLKSIVLSLFDDGDGFPTNRVYKGMGLKNMRYRAKEINAQISIDSKPGSGTKIEVIVPNLVKRKNENTSINY